MTKFVWGCSNGDSYRGCFNPDWDGVCRARSRKTFDTEEAARRAANAHDKICRWRRWGQGTHVYLVDKKKPKMLRISSE